jgi:hypothetical protein
MVSERTPHEEGGSTVRSRERNRAIPCNLEAGIDGNIGAHDEDATDLCSVIRWMRQLDEEYVELPRQLGSRVHRFRTRHGAHLTDPREIVVKQWMG